MYSSTILAVALAGAAIAITPSGFTPSSSQDMTVAFGNTLAVNGKEMQKEETAKAPTIGTSEKLSGTYAIMMVDPDVPTGTGGTVELLHWMQAGLVSANTSTTIGGVKTFELINPNNSTAFATYIQPSPPNKAPNTHRYTQLLLNTTGSNSTSALTTLAKSAMSRANFSASNVISAAGVKIVAGNSFDVTNGTLVQSNITKTTSRPAGAASATGASSAAAATGASSTAAADSNSTDSSNSTVTSPSASAKASTTAGAAEYKSGAAYFAGFAALAAAVLML